MIHHLKTWPEYFKLVIADIKTFEVRKNDRSFKAGDKLVLEEYDPHSHAYTGNKCTVWVNYVFEPIPAEHFGLKPNYCVMSIDRIEDA